MPGRFDYLHSQNPNYQPRPSSPKNLRQQLLDIYGPSQEQKEVSPHDMLAANLTHNRPSNALPEEDFSEEDSLELIEDSNNERQPYGVPQTGPRPGRRRPDASAQRQDGPETNMNRRILGAQ